MKATRTPGIYQDKNRLFTVNPSTCTGITVYNERLVTSENSEYRSWNPYRSKLAAALHKNFHLSMQPTSTVLYLGAATGTTVSHIADILTDGVIYAVEHSPVAATKLLALSKQRHNIIPIVDDAFHPDRYASLISPVDLIYQDISQRNQAAIFLENSRRYLKTTGHGILMVKARSIDVALPPKKVYEQVKQQLIAANHIVTNIIDLAPYQRDHAALIITPKQHQVV